LLASASGTDAAVLENLEFEIDTEYFMGAKRGDLHIVGRSPGAAEEPPALVWSVEVKVGSGLHESSIQQLSDDEEISAEESSAEGLDTEMVIQLRNYDDWLCRQTPATCGGFVLALNDLSARVDVLNLKRKWKCISWTWLGLQIKSAIEGGQLAPEEQLLARHLLGFISTNLWRTDEMPESELRLDFNDIALIRAFTSIGRECERKVNALIKSIEPLVAEIDVGGEMMIYQMLYKVHSNSCVGRRLVGDSTKESEPTLWVSIGCGEESEGDYMCVNIEMSPKHAQWDAVRKVVTPVNEKLLRFKRTPGWTTWQSEDQDGWNLMCLSAPLTSLLASENQEEEFNRFVRQGLADLTESGALTAISHAISKLSDKRSAR
jgi:hypothetical protein